jgi:hypothetical protein
MKLLLDECVHRKLRPLLRPHEVDAVRFIGWEGTRNGKLLRRAADAGYQALITIDQGMAYQQHEPTLPLPVVLLKVRSNDYQSYLPHIEPLLALLEQPLRSKFYTLDYPS